MSVLLPACPYPDRRNPTLLDFGGLIGGDLGGSYQRLNRLGNRHSLDVTLPSGQASGATEEQYRVYISRLKRGLTQGVILQFPQMSLVTTGSGAPVVDASGGVSGSTLGMRGFMPGYNLAEGQFFSLIHSGRRYLHSLDGGAIVGPSGSGVLQITPMLRVPPADGDVLEFDKPYIEGFLQGKGVNWTTDYAYQVGLSFTIVEAG